MFICRKCCRNEEIFDKKGKKRDDPEDKRNNAVEFSFLFMQKEAKARIKINNLLQSSGWRFFDEKNGKANILLENNVKITKKAIDDFGNDFEKTKKGFVDFLLLDEKGFPSVVLEAKSEDKDPLDGKEQARKYAQSLECPFYNPLQRQSSLLLEFGARKSNGHYNIPNS